MYRAHSTAFVIALSLSLVACGAPQATDCPTVPRVTAPTTPAHAADARQVADANINAVLWTQTSVEFGALTTQVYRGAMASLDAGLADDAWTAAPAEQADGYQDLEPAVILDLDETVLDNSDYQAWLVATGGTFGLDTWNAWCEARAAGAIPGALEFITYARERGVTVFFISNRSHETEEATRANLQALGIALEEDMDTVLLEGERPEWGSAKGPRRAIVTAEYRVILSIGDNLGDFIDDYKVTTAERERVFAAEADRWGREWILLPNPQYGSWEQTLYGFDYGLPAEEQRAQKLEQLRVWTP